MADNRQRSRAFDRVSQRTSMINTLHSAIYNRIIPVHINKMSGSN